MGANATVYEKPPTFEDGSDEFADYSNFKGPTTDKTVVQEIRFSKKGYGSADVIPAQTIPKAWKNCCTNGGSKIAFEKAKPIFLSEEMYFKYSQVLIIQSDVFIDKLN